MLFVYPLRRFVSTVGKSLFADKVDILDTVTISLPVNRGDVEASRMNNGRYLTLMDLGRFALTLRCGYGPILAKRRWYPLVTGVIIHFRNSLRVGTKFDLSTRVLCWDDKRFFLEQWFEQRGKVRARAFVKARFMGQSGPLEISELLAAGGFSTTSPPIPEHVRAWETAEAALKSPLDA